MCYYHYYRYSWAKLHKNYCTDLPKNFRKCSPGQQLIVIKFWWPKVKGQGRGRQKGQKHIFGHISASSWRRELQLGLKFSERKGLESEINFQVGWGLCRPRDAAENSICHNMMIYRPEDYLVWRRHAFWWVSFKLKMSYQYSNTAEDQYTIQYHDSLDLENF